MIHFLYGAGWGIAYMFRTQDTRDAFLLGWISASTFLTILIYVGRR